jgi:hypothetical protein
MPHLATPTSRGTRMRTRAILQDMLLQLRACIDDLDAGPINDGSPGLLALCSVLENIFNFGFITKCV